MTDLYPSPPTPGRSTFQSHPNLAVQTHQDQESSSSSSVGENVRPEALFWNLPPGIVRQVTGLVHRMGSWGPQDSQTARGRICDLLSVLKTEQEDLNQSRRQVEEEEEEESQHQRHRRENEQNEYQEQTGLAEGGSLAAAADPGAGAAAEVSVKPLIQEKRMVARLRDEHGRLPHCSSDNLRPLPGHQESAV